MPHFNALMVTADQAVAQTIAQNELMTMRVHVEKDVSRLECDLRMVLEQPARHRKAIVEQAFTTIGPIAADKGCEASTASFPQRR